MEEWYGQVAPREKLLKYGAAVLTDAELLAIFLRTGIPGMHVMQMAEYLIEEFGSLYGLISADYQALCAKKGLVFRNIVRFRPLQNWLAAVFHPT